jgi:hypothetical protein
VSGVTADTRIRRGGLVRSDGPRTRCGGLLLTAFGLLTVGVIGVVWYAAPMRHWLDVAAFGLLLALGAGTGGLLLGLVFGVPRATPIRGGGPGEQVSDWLIKIIIGVGLAELGRVLIHVGHLGRLLATGFGGQASSATAAGVVMVYFGPTGFLFGYVLARDYLTPTLRGPAEPDMVPAGSVATPLRRAISGLPRIRMSVRTRSAPPAIPVPRSEPRPGGEPVDLATLLARLHDLLAELVLPLSARGRETCELTAILVRRGVLSVDLAAALTEFAAAAGKVAAGATMSPLDAAAVRKSGGRLLAELAQLRSVAARAFEMCVLEALDTERRPGWLLFPDHSVGAATVDALVVDQAGGEAVVEVRARCAADATDAEVAALRSWLAGLPDDLPVLLVLPGDRNLALQPTGRRGPVRVVHWDYEAASFVPTLAGLLGA